MLPGSMVIASIAVLVVLLLSFGYLYLCERKPFILFWFLAQLLLLITYISRLPMIMNGYGGIFLKIVNFISTIGSYLLICKGTRMFAGKVAHPVWDMAFAALSLTYIFSLVLGFSPQTAILPALVYSIAILAYTGFSSISSSKQKGSIKYLLGCSFFVWSAASVLYPLCNMLKIVPADYGYFLIGIIGLITIINLQAAYYDSVREELVSKDNNIMKLLMFDKLTGVYSRTYYEDITAEFFHEFQLPAVLAVADINGLKLLNDTFGHRQGDELLVEAVQLMKNSVDENDVIIRWGGDEFIIIMPHTTLPEAEKTVERIKSNCRTFRSKTIPIDISLGLAYIKNCDCGINDVVAQAEERMYSSKLRESKQTRMAIIEFLEKLLWEKDYQTEEHVARLKSLVLKIGEKVGLSSKEIDELSQVALLHDIGKIAVPVEILNKPGALTPDEWKIMKKHTETGYRIAQSSREFAHISEAILGHHEWWNGNGYPQGLKGEEISLYSRMISIIDSFDVITHDRPYKKAVGTSEALNEIKRCAGTQYDPQLAEIFINIMTEGQ